MALVECAWCRVRPLFRSAPNFKFLCTESDTADLRLKFQLSLIFHSPEIESHSYLPVVYPRLKDLFPGNAAGETPNAIYFLGVRCVEGDEDVKMAGFRARRALSFAALTTRRETCNRKRQQAAALQRSLLDAS